MSSSHTQFARMLFVCLLMVAIDHSITYYGALPPNNSFAGTEGGGRRTLEHVQGGKYTAVNSNIQLYLGMISRSERGETRRKKILFQGEKNTSPVQNSMVL